MTEDLRAGITPKEHPEERKYIFWGPITRRAYVEYQFYTGGPSGVAVTFSAKEMNRLKRTARSSPVLLLSTERASWWAYKGTIYRHNEALNDAVAAKGLIIQQKRRREARLEKARKIAAEAQSDE